MTQWFSENWGTLLVVLVLAVIVLLIVRSIIKDKKAGRSSCGAGCAGCAMKGSCRRQK